VAAPPVVEPLLGSAPGELPGARDGAPAFDDELAEIAGALPEAKGPGELVKLGVAEFFAVDEHAPAIKRHRIESPKALRTLITSFA
jgi:hypothetical protein